jgi:hypothetical protein
MGSMTVPERVKAPVRARSQLAPGQIEQAAYASIDMTRLLP